MYSSLNRKQLLTRMFSNAGIYGVGIFINRLGNFLLLPIIWLKLEPHDFGIIALSQVVIVFLAPLLSMGLYDSVQRMYHEWQNDYKSNYLSVLWLTSIVLSASICVALIIFGEAFFNLILSQIPFQPFVIVMLVTAFANNLSLFPLTLMRIREELITFNIVTIGMFITQASIIIYLIYYFDMGALGYLLGIMFNSLLWGIYFIWYMTTEIKLSFKVNYLKEPLRYSLPLVPASILEGVGSVFDRIFLDKYASLSQIGLYNLGYQFGTAVNSFNQIMKSSWVPLIIRVITDRSDGPDILSRLSIYYISAMALPALVVALLAKEFIEGFGGTKYQGIYPYVPYFVLIFYIQSIGTAIGRGLDLAKKTIYSPIIPIITILTNFIAMWILIPRYGVWGAVIAFILTTTIRISTHIGLALYFYPRPILLKQYINLIFIVFITFLIGYQVHTGNIIYDTILKLVVILVGMLLLTRYVLDWNHAKTFIKERLARY